jgi:hypothetical protein
MNQNWGVLACIGAFGLTFAGGVALIVSQRQDPPPLVPPAPVKPEAPKEEEKEKPPPKVEKKEVVNKPTKPTRAVIIQQWKGTQPPAPKGENSPNFEDFFYREIAFDRYGGKLVGYTNREAVCWDAIGGNRLHTFPVASRVVPRKPPNPPDFVIDQQIRITRDGRVVAMIDKNGKSVTLYEASSGTKIGTYKAPKDRSEFTQWRPPEFTPRGDSLVYCINGGGNRDEICAVSASTAAGRKVSLGRAFKEERFDWIVLIPLLDQSIFIRQWRGDIVKVLDLNTGQERKLDSVTVKPFSLFENRGIKVSPDRRYLSARSITSIEVVDWQKDQRLMKAGAETIHNEWWTPCGKRLVILKSTNWITYRGGHRITPIGGWLELWDVQKGVKIGDFEQDKVGLMNSVSAIAFTPDGKRFALADRAAGIAVLDFEMAFGVAPLPPVAHPEE